jgi:hypothetical protein
MSIHKPKSANKIQFLPPKKISLSMLASTGQHHAEYPTITISYIGVPLDSTPDDLIISDLQAFSVDYLPIEGSTLADINIMAFGQPQKELLDFSDCYTLDFQAPTKSVNPIFVKMRDLGRYMIYINTEFYSYKALIDNDTGEILEANVDYRMVN